MTAGVYLGACVLLVAAGAAKLRRPRTARDALAGAGIRVPAAAIRLGGAGEVVLGTAAAATGSASAAVVVAVVYAGFALFAAAVLWRGGRAAPCGCFGGEGDRVHPCHVAVDLGLAAAAAAVSAAGGLGAGPVARAGLVVLGAGVAWVAYLVLVPFPRLLAAVREAGG